jgi:hypothetical protein
VTPKDQEDLWRKIVAIDYDSARWPMTQYEKGFIRALQVFQKDGHRPRLSKAHSDYVSGIYTRFKK